MNKSITLFFLLLVCSEIVAQNQYNVWYAGAHDPAGSFQSPGVDFNGTAPTSLNNSEMGFTEGGTVMCDASGNLLFYTDGSTVLNAMHDTMLNGENLGLGAAMFTTTQNSIAIPFLDTNYYGLIVNDGLTSGTGTGLFYSTIDRTLDGGLGGINAVKNIPILSNTHEKLVAIRHNNGTDFWIVTVVANNYYAYLFTSPQDYNSTDLSCMIADTVVSYGVGPLDISGAYNRIKVSPQNDKLALMTTSSGDVFFLDFDNSTGAVSNPFMVGSLSGIVATVDTWSNAYSFSPDGSYFYVIRDSMPNPFIEPVVSKLYQFDMSVPEASIPGTKQLIGVLPDSVLAGISVQFSGDLQIGPDGKVYISYMSLSPGENNSFFSAIDNPNTAGASIIDMAVSLGGNRSHHTLPNLITDYLIAAPSTIGLLNAGFIYSNNCGSLSASFQDTSNGGPASWHWNFNDPSSGILNTSDLQNPDHVFSATGTYSVVLIISKGCRTDTITQTVVIPSSTAPSNSGDIAICEGDSTSLSIIGATSQSWYPSAGLSDTLSANPVASPLSTTLYYIASEIGSCTFLDSILVTVGLPSLTSINPPDSICAGDSILIFGVFQSTPGLYHDTLSSITTCDSIIERTLVVLPTYTATDSMSICPGDSVLIFGNYISVAGTYTEILSSTQGCDSVTITHVDVLSAPTASFSVSGDTGFVPFDITITNTTIGASDYLWQMGDGTTSYDENPFTTYYESGNYSITLEATSIDGCSDMVTYSFIVVMEGTELIIPNVFTPNQDGSNDQFEIHMSGYESALASIYDRWGKLLYQWDPDDTAWNGNSASGRPLPSGTYYYIVDIIGYDGVRNSHAGHLMLNR